MTGISDLIAKKEQQARDDERKEIVDFLSSLEEHPNVYLLDKIQVQTILVVSDFINSGKYRKGAK